MEDFRLDFVGLGAERSGTSWLADKLRQHPEVCFAKTKELHFFNRLYVHDWSIENTNYRDLGFDWYRNQFLDCLDQKKLKGEFSPGYYCDPLAAQRIAKHFPQAKLMLTIRHPIKRAMSQFRHEQRLGVTSTKKTFAEIIKQRKNYLEKGKYFNHIKTYLKYFPNDQLLVVLLADIRDNPTRTYSRVCQFLEIDANYVPENLSRPVNGLTSAKYPVVNRSVYQLKRLVRQFHLTQLIQVVGWTKVDKWMMNLISQQAQITPTPIQLSLKLEKQLHDYYKTDIEQLEQWLQRDLSSWRRLD